MSLFLIAGTGKIGLHQRFLGDVVCQETVSAAKGKQESPQLRLLPFHNFGKLFPIHFSKAFFSSASISFASIRLLMKKTATKEIPISNKQPLPQ